MCNKIICCPSHSPGKAPLLVASLTLVLIRRLKWREAEFNSMWNSCHWNNVGKSNSLNSTLKKVWPTHATAKDIWTCCFLRVFIKIHFNSGIQFSETEDTILVYIPVDINVCVCVYVYDTVHSTHTHTHAHIHWDTVFVVVQTGKTWLLFGCVIFINYMSHLWLYNTLSQHPTAYSNTFIVSWFLWVRCLGMA